MASATITQNQRDQWVSQGVTLDKSGAWPIPNVAFLRKAIMSFGRARPDERDAVLAHIKARAKALGALNLSWVSNFLQSHGAGGS